MRSWSLSSRYKLPIIVADMANNHSGSKELALKIISELVDLKAKYGLPIVVKFQYRNLETFIDSKYKGNHDYKFISRFESTKLEWNDFEYLVNIAKESGLLTAATPFDEFSALKVKQHNHDILKIASASATDWNLLELCTNQRMPMLVSVGGLNDTEIEKVVTFLKHRDADFAIMHCVALYPTPDSNLNLGRIRDIKAKFRVTTGYSTHENPSNVIAGSLAIAAGAEILERHYGIKHNQINLNQYSSGYDEFEKWLVHINLTLVMDRDVNFEKSLQEQLIELTQLKRGLYASKAIGVGDLIDKSNTYGAIPVFKGQLLTNDLTLRYKIENKNKIEIGSPIYKSDVNIKDSHPNIEKILSKTRMLLGDISVTLGTDVDVEISHHYGIEKFDEYGAILIPVINREYAKKIVVMNNGQIHPEHFHEKKEETFIMLLGKLEVNLDKTKHILLPGDTIVINRGRKHSMHALSDTVFEEISSTNFENDSFYTNQYKLSKNRKTKISLWV